VGKGQCWARLGSVLGQRCEHANTPHTEVLASNPQPSDAAGPGRAVLCTCDWKASRALMRTTRTTLHLACQLHPDKKVISDRVCHLGVTDNSSAAPAR
jgi:hypothetical protein